MPFEDFNKLDVYRDSERMADVIYHIVIAWPPFEKSTLGHQLVRAADSVGANIAEGWGRETWRDRAHHCHLARASLMEVRHWLRRAHRRGLLAEGDTAQLAPLIDRLSPRLNAYISHLKRRAEGVAPSGVREEGSLYEPEGETGFAETPLLDLLSDADAEDPTGQPAND